MAQSTLRENRRSATHQLAAARNQAGMMVLVQQAFYRHDTLGPGASLRQITGVSDQAGYYDWAGRRLFLADGEPDPMCPGAYRYQHNPACCDLEAPDSDPRSPRYEPMHLRHKPGDTWIIDTNRPHDPFDPGPFGTPGWYQDERTGRHRRDETPDPLPDDGWVSPPNAWFPGTADWPEPQAAQPTPPWQGRRDQPRTGNGDRPGGDAGDNDDANGNGHSGTTSGGSGQGPTPPWGSRGRPVPSEPDEPPHRPWGDRAGREAPTPEADRPTRRPWDHTESNGDNPTDERDTDDFRFSNLREAAFDRFMANSAQLRAAHFAPEKPYLRERIAWALRWLLWVLACGLAPAPAPLTTRQRQPEPTAPQPIPTQPGPSNRPQPPHAENAMPSAAIAAAINGARTARKVIAARETRTSAELATAVRNSANRNGTTSDTANHWRAHPRQTWPRPSPRPNSAAYMTAWEQAFDTGHTLNLGILATGGAA